MGIIWSWAFGEESYQTLKNLGFTFNYSESGNYEINDRFTYSYAGEPPGRSSIRVRANRQVYPPLGAPAQGCISVAFFCTDPVANNSGCRLISIDLGGKEIRLENNGMNSMKMILDSISSASITITGNVWHWITMKYDARVSNPWKGQVWLDGVNVTGGGGEIEDTSGEATLGDNNVIYFDGICDEGTWFGSVANTWIGAIVIHDDYTDPAEVPRFVTRVQPTSLESSAGSWSAVSAPTVLDAVTGSMINSSSYALNTTTIVGNNILFEAGTTIDGALGCTASYVDGVTMHFVASGSGPFAQAQLSDNSGGSWATGSSVMLTVGNSGYGYASAPTRPQAGGAWSGSSDLYLKYEAS